jgi:dTDP-4-dehydrorhamnose reductase
VSNRQVLITGSSGFLGIYLVKFVPANRTQIVAQYRNQAPEPYGKPIKYIQLDFLRNDWSELEQLRPDVIIHTAAVASIDECEVNPSYSHKVNFHVTKRLAELADKCGSRFIFISSDVVYEGSKSFHLEIETPLPKSKYAQSKIEAEQFLLKHLSNVVVVRPSLFYGLGLDGRPSFAETMLNNLYAGKQVYVFTDQYRTPMLVNNLASALWELAENEFNGIINLGGPKRVNRCEMGEILCELFKLDNSLLIPITSEQAKLVAHRPYDCSLDTSLASKVLKTQFVDCRIGFSISYR